MAEGVETTAQKASEIVQDVGDTIQDSLILTNLTSSKDAADNKYANSLSSVSKEQELHLDNQVSPSLLTRKSSVHQSKHTHLRSMRLSKLSKLMIITGKLFKAYYLKIPFP